MQLSSQSENATRKKNKCCFQMGKCWTRQQTWKKHQTPCCTLLTWRRYNGDPSATLKKAVIRSAEKSSSSETASNIWQSCFARLSVHRVPPFHHVLIITSQLSDVSHTLLRRPSVVSPSRVSIRPVDVYAVQLPAFRCLREPGPMFLHGKATLPHRKSR